MAYYGTHEHPNTLTREFLSSCAAFPVSSCSSSSTYRWLNHEFVVNDDEFVTSYRELVDLLCKQYFKSGQLSGKQDAVAAIHKTLTDSVFEKPKVNTNYYY